MLIGVRKIVYTNSFFKATNIRENVQIILHILNGYFTKWCLRDHLLTKR